VRLAELLPEEGCHLESRLAEVKDSAEGIGILEDFLLDRLRNAKIDPRVEKAVRLIDECGGESGLINSRRNAASAAAISTACCGGG
jgi:hypothetical protein